MKCCTQAKFALLAGGTPARGRRACTRLVHVVAERVGHLPELRFEVRAERSAAVGLRLLARSPSEPLIPAAGALDASPKHRRCYVPTAITYSNTSAAAGSRSLGHIRLGRLPKSARWREVVGVMESDPQNAERIAAATLVASEDYLRSVRNDPALGRAYWTLVRLMAAARGDDFAGELRRLGLPSDGGGSSIAFLAGVADSVRRESADAADGSMAGEIAGLALRRALMETVGTQATSMFGSTVDDLQAAFRAHAKERQFGEVSRLFFGDFLARVLRGALDREAPRLLGAARERSDAAAGRRPRAPIRRHRPRLRGRVALQEALRTRRGHPTRGY